MCDLLIKKSYKIVFKKSALKFFIIVCVHDVCGGDCAMVHVCVCRGRLVPRCTGGNWRTDLYSQLSFHFYVGSRGYRSLDLHGKHFY